jgi:hypothetical protein
MIEIKNEQNLVKTSYSKDDVLILLKDLSNEMEELSTEQREQAIQKGRHYSEMLPKENKPSVEYEELYQKALTDKKKDIADGIARVAEMMYSNTSDGDKPVIISLARAGIPIGILIKRYLKYRYNINCSHYAISIIRDKGIDVNAMNFIYGSEVNINKNSVRDFFFVDGWTGKGVIKKQLEEAVELLKNTDNKWNELRSDLYVLADPANVTEYCGTRKDYLLPSACLNSTVSGLTSRTILNNLVDTYNGDFHGSVYFSKFEDIDQSNEFIDRVSAEFMNISSVSATPIKIDEDWNGMSIVDDLCNLFNIADYKKVKPGIGETTRVLLRRIPWKVFINKDISDNDPDIQHILMLCEDKHISTMRWDLGNYKVCGVIKDLSADA